MLTFAPHDHELAADDPLAQLCVDSQAPHLAAAHEIEIVVALDFRQTMLLDQQLDLRPTLFAVGFFLPTLLQGLRARRFRRLIGRLGCLSLRDALLFLRLAFCLLGCFLLAESGG